MSNIKYPVERDIQKYKHHTNEFNETFVNKKTFSFDFVSSDTILKEIVSLNANRATYSNDVPTKNVQANSDSFSNFVSNSNESGISCSCLSVLKLADVTPVNKKKSRLKKSNYRPVSLLLNISKIFERCIHRKISEYFETCYFRNFNVVFEKDKAPKTFYWRW